MSDSAGSGITFDQLESRPGFFATKAAREGRPERVTFLPEPDRRPRWCTLISVDDHLVEPAHLFEGRLPRRYADFARGSRSTTRAWSSGRTTGSGTTRSG